MGQHSKLTNLIISLTPQEKRYFHLFTKSLNVKEKYYIYLFEILNQNPTINNEKLKQSLKNKNISMPLNALKKYWKH